MTFNFLSDSPGDIFLCKYFFLILLSIDTSVCTVYMINFELSMSTTTKYLIGGYVTLMYLLYLTAKIYYVPLLEKVLQT